MPPTRGDGEVGQADAGKGALLRVGVGGPPGALFAKLLEERIDVVANVIGSGLGVGHQLVAGLAGLRLRARFEDASEEIFRLGGQVLKLIGQTPTRDGAALRREHHPERKPERPTGQRTPDPSLYGTIS